MHDERAESWSGRETRVDGHERGVAGREYGVAGREKGVAGRRAQLQWMSATLTISFILKTLYLGSLCVRTHGSYGSKIFVSCKIVDPAQNGGG